MEYLETLSASLVVIAVLFVALDILVDLAVRG